MAVVMRKRKRDTTRPATERNTSDGSDEEESSAKALFQRAFEAKFKPLRAVTTQHIEHPPQVEDLGSVTSDLDDWNGLESEPDHHVEVIEYGGELIQSGIAQASGKKAFMSSRIPTQSRAHVQAEADANIDTVDMVEKANLKNDIALQRLLRESRLLQDSGAHTIGHDIQGPARVKALDLRMRDLGSKSSHLHQKNMPITHRKGIQAKATQREQKRRQEAAENGIVLERVKSVAKETARRERSIGGPGIGQFRGGMLKLSKKDVRNIEASGAFGSQRRKRGRR